MTIQCITFDLDDTLWECWPVIKRAEQTLQHWLHKNYPRITHNFSPEELISHRMEFMKTMPHMRHDLTHTRKEWLKALAKQNGYDESISEAGFRVFWEARNDVTFLEGILEALETLQKDYRLGVITNGNADVDHIGVGHLFDFSVKAEQAGASKPDPDIYHMAIDKAGLAAHNILHIGDDPVGDIKGAQDVGMKTIWVNYNQKAWQYDHQPDAIITSPVQLTTTVNRLKTQIQN